MSNVDSTIILTEIMQSICRILERYVENLIILDEKKIIIWTGGNSKHLCTSPSMINKPFDSFFKYQENDIVYINDRRFFCCSYDIGQNQPHYICLILEEMSESQDVQFKLNLYEQIFDKIYEGVLASDANGKIILYNSAIETIEGLRTEDVLGRYLWDVYGYKDINQSDHQKVYKSGKEIHNYKSYSYATGKPHYISSNIYPVVYHNNNRGAFSVIKNEVGLNSMLSQIMDQKRKFQQDSNTVVSNEKYSNGTQFSFSDIVGASKDTDMLIQEAQSIAMLESNTLIIGETGTGKEVYAQSIHNYCKKDKPFIGVNCAAIPETLFESTMFGSVKGAYTGATDTVGLFELAKDGTIFLDELNSMSMAMQSKLLRTLQERCIRRVGGHEPIPLRCRFISAMNINPQKLIENNQLRQDLYYRIAAICLYIKSLRERKEDIDALVKMFINKCNKYLNKQVMGMSPLLRERVIQYSWPGNVRELENFIENCMVRVKNDSTMLDLSDIPYYIKDHFLKATDQETLENGSINEGTLVDTLTALERKMILNALNKCDLNISHAAKMLGIIRQSLIYRMKKLNISISRTGELAIIDDEKKE